MSRKEGLDGPPTADPRAYIVRNTTNPYEFIDDPIPEAPSSADATTVLHRHPLADNIGLDDVELTRRGLILESQVPSKTEMPSQDTAYDIETDQSNDNRDSSTSSGSWRKGRDRTTPEGMHSSMYQQKKRVVWWRDEKRTSTPLGSVVEEPDVTEDRPSPSYGQAYMSGAITTNDSTNQFATEGAKTPINALKPVASAVEVRSAKPDPEPEAAYVVPPRPRLSPIEYARIYYIELARCEREGIECYLPAPETYWAWTEDYEKFVVLPRLPRGINTDNLPPNSSGSQTEPGIKKQATRVFEQTYPEPRESRLRKSVSHTELAWSRLTKFAAGTRSMLFNRGRSGDTVDVPACGAPVLLLMDFGRVDLAANVFASQGGEDTSGDATVYSNNDPAVPHPPVVNDETENGRASDSPTLGFYHYRERVEPPRDSHTPVARYRHAPARLASRPILVQGAYGSARSYHAEIENADETGGEGEYGMAHEDRPPSPLRTQTPRPLSPNVALRPADWTPPQPRRPGSVFLPPETSPPGGPLPALPPPPPIPLRKRPSMAPEETAAIVQRVKNTRTGKSSISATTVIDSTEVEADPGLIGVESASPTATHPDILASPARARSGHVFHSSPTTPTFDVPALVPNGLRLRRRGNIDGSPLSGRQASMPLLSSNGTPQIDATPTRSDSKLDGDRLVQSGGEMGHHAIESSPQITLRRTSEVRGRPMTRRDFSFSARAEAMGSPPGPSMLAAAVGPRTPTPVPSDSGSTKLREDRGSAGSLPRFRHAGAQGRFSGDSRVFGSPLRQVETISQQSEDSEGKGNNEEVFRATERMRALGSGYFSQRALSRQAKSRAETREDGNEDAATGQNGTQSASRGRNGVRESETTPKGSLKAKLRLLKGKMSGRFGRRKGSGGDGGGWDSPKPSFDEYPKTSFDRSPKPSVEMSSGGSGRQSISRLARRVRSIPSLSLARRASKEDGGGTGEEDVPPVPAIPAQHRGVSAQVEEYKTKDTDKDKGKGKDKAEGQRVQAGAQPWFERSCARL
ncbi:uncharacterized protein DNG_07102 [Cephalotrichum gorgonifer]|uniref:Uncharacterized protein n=1 Tax=Cephalotrichum gorgonifer TaxID=2041049 RepID=A0AAE8N1V3_9PEZI|nr:uncharacterized protein DNG_07102 [Cephalotrichum gorgonifer]